MYRQRQPSQRSQDRSKILKILFYSGVRVEIPLSLNCRTLALPRCGDEGCDFHFSAPTWGVRGAALGGSDVERARGAGTMPQMGTPGPPRNNQVHRNSASTREGNGYGLGRPPRTAGSNGSATFSNSLRRHSNDPPMPYSSRSIRWPNRMRRRSSVMPASFIRSSIEWRRP